MKFQYDATPCKNPDQNNAYNGIFTWKKSQTKQELFFFTRDDSDHRETLIFSYPKPNPVLDIICPAIINIPRQAKRRAGLYTLVHEDSSTVSTKQDASSVAFPKRSNITLNSAVESTSSHYCTEDSTAEFRITLLLEMESTKPTFFLKALANTKLQIISGWLLLVGLVALITASFFPTVLLLSGVGVLIGGLLLASIHNLALNKFNSLPNEPKAKASVTLVSSSETDQSDEHITTSLSDYQATKLAPHFFSTTGLTQNPESSIKSGPVFCLT